MFNEIIVEIIIIYVYFCILVCPMNWKPNSPTIRPDPNLAKEYFGKVNK